MGLDVIGATLLGGPIGTSLWLQADARNQQRRAANEQRGMNAAAAARERRQQVREERIRRAQIIQSAQSTGTSESSGEAGAVGSLSTQLSSNIGANIGKINSSNQISIFEQKAADDLMMKSLLDQFTNIGSKFI